jgi:hypothetical protein
MERLWSIITQAVYVGTSFRAARRVSHRAVCGAKMGAINYRIDT